jgi:hypothetical protein
MSIRTLTNSAQSTDLTKKGIMSQALCSCISIKAVKFGVPPVPEYNVSNKENQLL